MSFGKVEPQPDPAEDHVLAEYDVYLTPQLVESLYLLQYPNRSRNQLYSEERHAKPSELRIKPRSGFVEVDVPMNMSANFDKRKSVAWGQALQKMREEGNGQDFGLASGFSSRVLPATRPRAGPGGTAAGNASGGGAGTAPSPTAVEEVMELDGNDELDRLLYDFQNANNKGYVMNTQTLGGQIQPPNKGDYFYMMGAFRGDQLHLTKVDGIVQMRPQFHHLDAKAQLDDANRKREARGTAEPRPTEPRAVQIVVKTMNDDEMNLNNAKDFLQKAEQESWTRLKYHDAEAVESYDAFEKLRLDESAVAASVKLHTTRTNEQFLEDISAPRTDSSGQKKTKPLTKKQMRAVERQAEEDAENERHSGGDAMEVVDGDATDV